MIIELLRLKDFRNYEELRIEPSGGVNLLFGQNGSGKTNIIEAIHYCALGKSHRTNQDREVVRRETTAAACGVILSKKFGKEDIAIKLTPNESKKKNIYIDRKKAQRISSLMGHVQCVIFSPEDLMLIKEGPGIRRKYMDMMISQMEPLYFIELQNYQKALDQRNAILKESKKTGIASEEIMESFEIQLAKSSAYIIPKRLEMIQKIHKIAAEIYEEISGRENEHFSMKYACCVRNCDEIEREVSESLYNSRTDDIYRGVTSFGIHREDIHMMLHEKDMKLFASQGQIRTAALSMKLAQIDLFKQETGENPILLLDDVMSELDMGRRKRLVEKISKVQTFITCTDESDIEFVDRPRSYHVSLNRENLGELSISYNGIDSLEKEIEKIQEPDFT